MTAIQPKVQAAHQHTPGSSIFSHLFLRGMEHKGCRSSQAGVTRLVGWSTCKASIGLKQGCTLLPFTFNSGLSNGSLICYVYARSSGLADPIRDRCLLESHNPASSSILTLHSTPLRTQSELWQDLRVDNESQPTKLEGVTVTVTEILGHKWPIARVDS